MPKIAAQDVTPKAFFDQYPNAIPIAAISIVEMMNEEGEHLLATFRDSDSMIWTHLGMVESMRGDLKQALLQYEVD